MEWTQNPTVDGYYWYTQELFAEVMLVRLTCLANGKYLWFDTGSNVINTNDINIRTENVWFVAEGERPQFLGPLEIPEAPGE